MDKLAGYVTEANNYDIEQKIDYTLTFCKYGGPGSVVGIATGYELGGPVIESRWGARSSVPVQTGPGAHAASCKLGTRTFPGVKSVRGVTLTPHTF